MPIAKLQPAFNGIAKEDMYVLDIQQNIIDYLKKAYVVVPDAGGGDGGIKFSSVVAFKDSLYDSKGNLIPENSITMSGLLPNGTEFEMLGYYQKGDGGNAHWITKTGISLLDTPWAIYIGESDVPDYVYKTNSKGDILYDDEGQPIIATDDKGNPLVNKNPDGTDKMLGLYAVINEQEEVNYRQFGAIMDGETDDGDALKFCHDYANSVWYFEQQYENTTNDLGKLGRGRKVYPILVANHSGIIYKKNNEPLSVFSSCDLSGSTLKVDSSNAGWFGFYVFGDNESDAYDYEPLDEKSYDTLGNLLATMRTRDDWQRDKFCISTKGLSSSLKDNCVISVEETNYSIRDDAGYLYQNSRKELWLHHKDGILSSPLMEDWSQAGGMMANILATDPNELQTSDKKVTKTLYTKLNCFYTLLNSVHSYFKGCQVEMAVDYEHYISVLWVKRHNCTISDFTFHIPRDTTLRSTVFRNAMIYLWDVCNVTVKNIKGFNGTGKKLLNGGNGSSGYMLRLCNTLNVTIEDCALHGYWGATAFYSCRNTYVYKCQMNRLDTHDYFSNMFVRECDFFQHGIQVGYGRGILEIKDCNFYYEFMPEDSYPHAHLLEFDLTYGRMFAGKIRIDNCHEYVRDDGDCSIFEAGWSPDAACVLKTYEFPDIYVSNCSFTFIPSANRASCNLAYFNFYGSRRCQTSTIPPSHKTDCFNDGTVIWQYIGRAIEWGQYGDSERYADVPAGTIIRFKKGYIDSLSKTTVFYNTRYYYVQSGGNLPEYNDDIVLKDDYTNFRLGSCTVKRIENPSWLGNKDYSLDDVCLTSDSPWFPPYVFKCIKAGHSNGYRPVHDANTPGQACYNPFDASLKYPAEQGIRIDGTLGDMEPDSVWWKYIDELKNWVVDYTPNMTLQKGQILYADGKLYEVMVNGTLGSIPPTETPWLAEFEQRGMRFKYLGGDWELEKWYKMGAYCVSNNRIYQAVRHDGICSKGEVAPLPGNKFCLDGDLVWEYVDDSISGTPAWQANTHYEQGAIVQVNGHRYRCYFDGRLTLPAHIVFDNVSVNGMNVYGVWCDKASVPTRANKVGTTLRLTNCSGVSASNVYKNTTIPFNISDNPNFNVVIDNVKVK